MRVWSDAIFYIKGESPLLISGDGDFLFGGLSTDFG